MSIVFPDRKPLSVAVIVPKYGLLGGAENFVFQLTERLAAFENITVDVFANKWRRGDAPIHFHKIWTLPFPRFLEPLSFALGVYCKTRQFDLIHSHDRIFAMDLFTFHGIPHTTWVNEVQKRPFPRLVDLMIAWIEKKGLGSQRLKKVLPVSSIAEKALRRCYRLPDTAVEIMPPGIASGFFTPYQRQTERERIRKQYKLSSDELVLLFVGMNFEIKNLDLVLEALAFFSDRGNTGIKLLVVGKGNENKYRKQAAALGIENLVRFCGPTDEVQPFYLSADVFIMPSRYDTFGMVVLEAMLAGLPPIISSNVGAKDLLDPKSGFVLSDSPDPQAVADILMRLQDPEIREKMGQNAEEKARQYFWDQMAERMYKLYTEILKEKTTHG